jgi:hypothetical protein
MAYATTFADSPRAAPEPKPRAGKDGMSDVRENVFPAEEEAALPVTRQETFELHQLAGVYARDLTPEEGEGMKPAPVDEASPEVLWDPFRLRLRGWR